MRVVRAQLVGNVRNESHLASALNSNGKFPLVTSANAGHTTGKNFAAFCHVLFKFSNVFVIDVFRFFNAEIANLAASGLSHRPLKFFVFHYPISLLKWHVVVIGGHFLKFGNGLIARLCRRRGGICAGAGQKLNLICTDVKGLASNAVAFVATGLDATRHGNLAALGKILNAVLCKSVPSDDVDEVCLVFAIARSVVAVNGNRKTAVTVSGFQRGSLRILS